MPRLASAALAAWLALSPLSAHAQAPSPRTADLADRVEALREAYGVPGLAVAVVQGQEPILVQGFGTQADGAPFGEETPVIAYSATKALSSVVFASLVEDGFPEPDRFFDPDTFLGELLDDAPAAWAQIPFYRLLNHTSGIPTVVDKPAFGAIASDPTSTNRDLYDVVRQLPLDHEPGGPSRYRQSGYAVAEMILEDWTGATWPELMAAHLTGPAGATATVHAHLASGERTSPLLASAGWYQTTARDMAAIFQALNAERVVSLAFLEGFLYQYTGGADGYSLGSILETIDGVRTIGHRGGGARAQIRYAPSRQVGVAVFTEATEADNRELAVHVADLLMREVALNQRVVTPVSALLWRLSARPAADLVAAYDAEKAREVAVYDFSRAERAVNLTGYALLRAERLDDAIEVFALNVREHPESANAHDSLGEAYLARGDRQRALASYRSALSLDPENERIQQTVAELAAAIDG